MFIVHLLLLAGCGLQSYKPEDRAVGDDTAEPDDGGIEVGGLAVNPSSVDFGSVELEAIAYEDVTVSNKAGRTLVIASASVDTEGVFWVESSVQLPSGLGDGEELVLTVGFSPEEAGAATGQLGIDISGEDEVPTVALSGEGVGTSSDDTGTGPDGGISLSTESIDFGSVYTNAEGSYDVVLTNDTSSSVLVENIVSSDPVFSTEGEIVLPQVMSPGSSKTLVVVFQPDDVQLYTATLTVATDSDVEPESTITLRGEGAEPPCTVCDPTISVDTGGSDSHTMEFLSALGFPDEKPLTIHNESDVDLELTDIYLNNDTTGGEFTISGLSPTTLSPWSSTSGTVTYTCAEVACLDFALEFTDTNILHVISNDPREPDYTISLTGL